MTQDDGTLTWETCQRILKPQTATDPDCYSTQREKIFILDMMQKFKLSFPLDTTTNPPTYPIPDLFKKSEPYTGEWEDSLKFQYRYAILPNYPTALSLALSSRCINPFLNIPIGVQV